jgi:hypothetical protein
MLAGRLRPPATIGVWAGRWWSGKGLALQDALRAGDAAPCHFEERPWCPTGAEGVAAALLKRHSSGK